jgi:hypothetical protein
MLFIIHVYLIIWLFGAYAKIIVTQFLKDDSLKTIAVNPMLYLLSTTCAHPCYFNHTG